MNMGYEEMMCIIVLFPLKYVIVKYALFTHPYHLMAGLVHQRRQYQASLPVFGLVSDVPQLKIVVGMVTD